MSGVATAIGVTGVAGAAIGSNATKKAAKKSAAAADAATAEQRRQYDLTRQDQMPWIQAGTNALTQLQNPTANFMASPDYTFRRDEGIRGIEQTAAARGGAFSGNALKALSEFNSNLASGEFGNWWNRQAGLAGVGQTATNAVGQFGANAASNIGNSLMTAGDARASGILGTANSLSGAINSGLNAYLYNRGGGFGGGSASTASRYAPPDFNPNFRLNYNNMFGGG